LLSENHLFPTFSVCLLWLAVQKGPLSSSDITVFGISKIMCCFLIIYCFSI